MSAYLILATLLSCTLVSATVVGGLVALGVSLPLAIVLVYLGVLLWMQGMQRRARDPYRSSERRRGNIARTGQDPSSGDVSPADQRSRLGDVLHPS